MRKLNDVHFKIDLVLPKGRLLQLCHVTIYAS